MEECSPQISCSDTQHVAMFQAGDTFSKAHEFFFVFGDWWIRLQTMKSLDTSFGPHAFPWINRQTQVKAGNRINKKTCCNLRTQTRSILGAFKGFSRVFIHKVEKTHMLVPNVFSGRWTTVDGWNPALIDGSFIPLFTGFYTSQVVVWDFFHQQYGPIQTISEYIACQEAWLLYRHAIVIVVTFKVLLLYISRCSDSRCWQLTRYTTHAHTSKCCWAFHVNELRRKTCCLIQHSASVACSSKKQVSGWRVESHSRSVEGWDFKVTFLGWLSDPFKGCWWPPTRGYKRHFESPGAWLLLVLVI